MKNRFVLLWGTLMLLAMTSASAVTCTGDERGLSSSCVPPPAFCAPADEHQEPGCVINSGFGYTCSNVSPPRVCRPFCNPFPGSYQVPDCVADPNTPLYPQESDLTYDPPLPNPAYQLKQGPVVKIDEAHNNFHTINNHYTPFANLLRRDGYRVGRFTKLLNAESLKTTKVLVIASAIDYPGFTTDEVAALRAWVVGGGRLFLIADHTPFARAGSKIAAAFGATFVDGNIAPTLPPVAPPTMPPKPPVFLDTFSLENGLLRESAITQGRDISEKVTQIKTFYGTAFKPPLYATPVLTVPVSMMVGGTLTNGLSQGIVKKVGKGRIAIFTEAGMFSAQVAGQRRGKTGMNALGAEQNYQLLLNVMHWLTRAEGMPN